MEKIVCTELVKKQLEIYVNFIYKIKKLEYFMREL